MEGEENQKTNILMVDDRPENLLALEAVLTNPEYNLLGVTSGEEALKWVLKESFAVILLDVQMPGLNGFETAKLIKAREKSKDIPIIFITAISQAAEHVIEGYGVGAIDYIFKPFQPEFLRRKIDGFVKIHKNIEKIKQQSKLLHQRASQLERMNKELEKATFELRKTEALTRAISETSIDTILSLNDEGYILNVNPAVVAMFGYAQNELSGQHVSKLLPLYPHEINGVCPTKADTVSRMVRCKTMETRGSSKEGQIFPVEFSLREASVDKQCIFVCSIRDITERKQIENERKLQYNQLEKLVKERTVEISLANKKLRLSEKRFRQIFELSPNLMSIISLEDFRYIDVNENWQKYTGYSIDEVKNKVIELFTILIENNSMPRSFGQILRDGPMCNVRAFYNTKSGERREGLLSTEILEIQEERCILMVVTDITERVLIENEMARLDRLNLIGETAAGIAHEIRNPMTTVRGFLQMLASRGESAKNKEYFDLMIEELDRANAIISEFLSLSKNQPLELKKCNINTLLEALFPLIQADAFNTKKDVQMELAEIPDLELDEREIRQMVLNLARNGLDAMLSGGTLTLRTCQNDEDIVLVVQDQGTGIEPEVLKKLGTPFFTTKEKGTGLGLAVCFGIAQKHKARIHIDTGEEGTQFTIHFPHKRGA